MRRLFAMLMVVCMILSLVACVSTEDTSEPTLPDEVIVDTETTSVPTSIETEAPADPVADIVLYDVDGIKITCKGYKEAGDWDLGSSLKFMVENNTDKNITVQVRDCSVNGFMIEPMCSADVAAGKKVNDDMTWFSTEFEENGITTVETIEFYFYIYDADSWDTVAESEIITLNFN